GYGWTDVMAAAEAIARGIAAFDLPPLGVQAVHGFLALRESLESPALQALSDACVAGADHLRAPPDAAELRRRGAGSLAPAQEEMLRRWGYPYVFSTGFFHMTLTRRLDSGEDAIYRPAATAFFADCLDLPRRVRDICVFSESAPGAPFRLAARVPLRG
ncbi:MAG: DUF1045 domain-containing protein, partial [Rhodospirillales bacterium]|nr:DUF1045 domain-containing protein [Rhodospirillales bacterium]